uniref:Reversion-inducing cysteine-rich protein with Kazal motifs n=1 Tax=Tetraodon nigroviridis TaxID=99883 RepID=H3CMQ0_TETNG
MSDFKLWSNGTIKMPYMNIPVLDIRKCLPDMWKAVACSLQIKPCHIKSRGSLICKSDCVDILTQCGDRRRFHEGQTPERICELLSPVDDPERCIPLHRYLGPSVLDSDRAEEVVHPCNPNPCPSNHVCQVNRRGCLDALRCQPYICLGEASDFLVQLDARVQVPTRTGPAGCYEVCSCGPSGRLENCVEMPCLDIHKPCVVGGQRRSPGSTFRVDCRLCSCLAGDSVCSRRRCLGSEGAQPQHLTGLPCDCPDRFVPVCASNGRNYPSACVARCLGFQDHQFVFGTCGMGNPAPASPAPGTRGQCVPRHRVCLSDSSACPQYECVGRPGVCDRNGGELACDTDGVVHLSVCHLQQAGKRLAYMGLCQEVCRKPQQVCGHNMETYNTVCHALADRVAVGLRGPLSRCGGPLGRGPGLCMQHCLLSTAVLPWLPACDPPRGLFMLQILWNKEAMNTFSKLNKNRPETVQDVLQVLRLHVSVPQCDVFGYLSIDHMLVVLVAPVERQPTPLQMEACSKEAEKIDSLINHASPTLVSHVPLSAFLTSEIRTTSVHSSGGCPPSPLRPGLCFLLGLLSAAPLLQQL